MSIRKRFLILGCFLLVASVLGVTSFIHAPKAFAYAEACPPTESEGANNTWVQVLQYRLDSLINNDVFLYTMIATDGDFGPQTKSAVVAWYPSSGGVANAAVWSSLGFCTGQPEEIPLGNTFPGTVPATLSNGSSGIWVQALQQMLNLDGISHISRGSWWPLTIDGSFGAQTEAAVKSFQAASGLTPQDGIVGLKTWTSFGMAY